LTHDRCSDQCACWKAGFRAAEREISPAVHEHCTEHGRRCLCYDRGRHSVKRPFVNLGHLPLPVDTEAEQAVLGLMIDAPHAAIPVVEGKLVADDFADVFHRYLFEKTLLAWNRGLMDDRGPERMRVVLLSALCCFWQDTYYPEDGYVTRCYNILDACWVPITTEEEEHGADCSLDDWFRMVEAFTAHFRDRLVDVTFRRALLQESPAILRPLLVNEDPRRTLAAILLRLRVAAHRARRPVAKKQTPRLVDTVIQTRRKERDARLRGL
jgi:hypothetical protein